jgi:hypothetical protein
MKGIDNPDIEQININIISHMVVLDKKNLDTTTNHKVSV